MIGTLQYAERIARHFLVRLAGSRSNDHTSIIASLFVFALALALTACLGIHKSTAGMYKHGGNPTTLAPVKASQNKMTPPPASAHPYKILKKAFTKPGREPGNTEGNSGKFITYPVVTDLPDKALEKKINTRIETFIGLRDLIYQERSVEVTYEQGPDLGCCLQFHFTIFSEGGAHPFTSESALVLDLETGEPYTLMGLFLPTGLAPLQLLIVQGLLEHFQIGFVDDFQIDENTNFTLDAVNLYLYFSDCEVISCSAGPAVIVIELDRLKAYINPKAPLAFIQ